MLTLNTASHGVKPLTSRYTYKDSEVCENIMIIFTFLNIHCLSNRAQHYYSP
jgi:hypothetical protein